jgi:hypothetical protein
MSRVKVIMVALAAVFAFSAVAAGTASAEWFVNGTKLVGSAALATTAKVDTDAVLRIAAPGGSVKILCSGTTLSGESPEIQGGTAEGMAKSLKFQGCSTIEPATKCELANQPTTIETTPLRVLISKVGGRSPLVSVTFHPLTKSVLTEIPFKETGNSCAFDEKEPVSGSLLVSAPTGETEEVEQAIEGLGTTENNSLQVAGDKAYIEGGRVLLKLASGSKWSFR